MYNKDELTIVLLSRVGVSRKKIDYMISGCDSIYSLIKTFPQDVKDLIGSEKTKKLQQLDLDIEIKNIDEFLISSGVKLTTVISQNFPEKLKDIPSRPVVLFYKGDLDIIKNNKILGVVGTRKPTSYGRFVTKKFTQEVVKAGVVTISGLAYGVDSEVARATLESEGKSIAVLGGGVCQIYPSSNAGLSKDIVESGGIVMSEYFPTDRPTQYTFPERNRIISGLSDGVLVVEAGNKSGSLITANTALEQGRELFVVPGNVDCPTLEGSNKLIEDYPDTFTISSEKILKALNIDKNIIINSTPEFSATEKLVLTALSTGIKTTDELCDILNEDYKYANLLLTEMEISGIIRKLPGDHYCRNI